MKKAFALIYGSELKFDESHYDISRDYHAVEKSDFEGKQISVSCYKSDIPSKRYSGMTVTDFALENQIAVGLPLNPVKCEMSRLSIESQITKSLES